MLYCIFSVQSTYCCLSREVLMKIIGMFSSFTVRCQNISPWQHFVFWNNLCSVLQFNKKSNFFLLGYETECSWVFFSILFTGSHIYELLCLWLSLRQPVPGWDHCRWGGWTGQIAAEAANGSSTGSLNIMCSMDLTSELLFSLCNWADNVPWFPLFCTSYVPPE